MAGRLKMQFFKLAFAFSMLSWLAACSTAPQRPTAAMSAESPGATVTAPTQALPTTARFEDPPTNVPPDERANDVPRSALLAGEAMREFERGGASWYGPGFHGRRTASGERYDMHAFTAAHRTLPFGTWVRVHSLVNGREVDVRITDRGPFIRSRVIDVSRGAAEALGMLGLGFKQVVLLVPESTPAAMTPSLPVTKGKRGTGRVTIDMKTP